MERLWRYYSGFQRARGGVGGLPAWARFVLTIVALPGIVAIALSILAFLVSLVALLLLTVPVYRLLRAVTGGGTVAGTGVDVVESGYAAGFMGDLLSPGRKRVDATVLEPVEPSDDRSDDGNRRTQ